MDLIFNPNKFFYDLIAIFSNLIDVAVSVCNKICGIPDEAGNNLIQNFFDEQIVGYIFLALGTIAMIFGLCVAMAETLRTKSEEGVTVLQPYVDYGKGMLWMIGVLAAFPLFILIIGIIGGIILDGLDGDLTLGEQILRNCFDTSSIIGNEGKLSDWNAIWDVAGIPSWADIKGANKDVADTFNAWIGLLGVGVITFPLIGIVVYMAKRLINIILLYAVAPISFGLYPADGGVAKAEWVKDMKGALIGGVVVMVMLQVFLFISGSIMKLELGTDNVTNMIYRSIIMGVGASTILVVSKNVLKYFGCDDQLLGTVGQFTAGRAFGAVRRGISSVKNRVKSRAGSSASSNSAEAETTSTQESLMVMSNKVASMRKSAMNAQRSSRAMGGKPGATVSGKAMPTGALKAGQAIEKMTKVSDRAKGHTYNSPTINKPMKETPNAISTKPINEAPAAKGGNVAKNGSMADSKKAEVKDLKPMKLEVKLNDKKLTKAMDKLGKNIEKVNKPDKSDKNSVVALKKPPKDAKTNNIKITQNGGEKGLHAVKAEGAINKPMKLTIKSTSSSTDKAKAKSAPKQPINIQNKLSNANTVTNNIKNSEIRESSGARDNNGEISNIKRELAVNKSRMQTIIDGQNKANRRTISLQNTLKKLSKKK